MMVVALFIAGCGGGSDSGSPAPVVAPPIVAPASNPPAITAQP